MKRKISLKINYFEDYHLLAIASPLKDYTLSFFINKNLDLNLKKYGDLSISAKGNPYSWFYFKQGNKYLSCFLIGNNHPKQKLMPALKNFDYFFLIKDAIDTEQVQLMATGIRSIQNVVGVFEQNMTAVKEMEELIRCNELHELEQTILPDRKSKNKK